MCIRDRSLAILDFAKAFDKVPHQRLPADLTTMGLEAHFTHGYHLSLPKECKRSCATERHPGEGKLHMAYHRVKFRLLTFLLSINDLPSKLQCTVSPFSDDCLLYAILVNPTSDAQLLQDDLYKLEEWQNLWQMQFNPKKCSIVCITLKKNQPLMNFRFSEKIQESECGLPSLLGCSVRQQVMLEGTYRICGRRC